MKRATWFPPLFALLILQTAALRGIALRPASGNMAGRHLAGEWRLNEEISQRLTGQRTGAPDRVTLTEDPTILGSLPPQVEERLGVDPVYLAGNLTFGKTTFSFLLTDHDGSQRLLCFKPGSTSPGTSILFDLVPAREPQNDLLFLGGEDDKQPVFAYERLSLPRSSGLSDETRSLLNDVLSNSFSPALVRLPERPDWQAAIDFIVEDLRRDPDGQNNNRCVALDTLVERHLTEVRLDIEPLLAVLASQSWTNQQKTADVLADVIRRPDLFKGKEKETVRAMIPLIASQRGPVVDPALQVLHALTPEKTLGRNPQAWAQWFESHFGEKIELRGSVFELVEVIATERLSNQDVSFRVDGKSLKDKGALRSQIQELIARAKAAGLHPRFAVVVPTPTTSAATQSQGLREAEPVREVLESLGILEITITPQDTVFYPPFEPGFPSRPDGAMKRN